MSESFPFSEDVAWIPDEKALEASNMKAFMRLHQIETLDDLQDRSVREPEWFWDAVIRDLDIEFHRPYDRVLDQSAGPEFPQWCVGGRMNIVHNLLDKWVLRGAGGRVALRCESEDGSQQTFTYAELKDEVCRAANGLTALGIGKGDAVGLLMPMGPERLSQALAPWA